MSTPEIRHERSGDESSIFRVHERAFDRSEEARLVDALHANGNLFLSLVASLENEIVGHIAFVPLVIESGTVSFNALGLAPLGVLPEHQGRGVGTALVREGLRECQERGHPLVIVLGDPNYYGKFGFVSTKPSGIHPPFDVPENVFMLRFAGGELPTDLRGVVRYTSEFDGLA